MKLLLIKLTALALVATSGVYAVEAPHAFRGSSDGFSDLSTDVSADVEVRNVLALILCFVSPCALSYNPSLFGFSIASSRVERCFRDGNQHLWK